MRRLITAIVSAGIFTTMILCPTTLAATKNQTTTTAQQYVPKPKVNVILFDSVTKDEADGTIDCNDQFGYMSCGLQSFSTVSLFSNLKKGKYKATIQVIDAKGKILDSWNDQSIEIDQDYDGYLLYGDWEAEFTTPGRCVVRTLLNGKLFDDTSFFVTEE